MNSEISAESTIIRLKQLLTVKTDFDLAEIIGVSKPTISAWRQRNSVPHTICIQMSQEKNVSLDWLLTGEGDTYKKTGLKPVSVMDKNGVVNMVNESAGAMLSVGSGSDGFSDEDLQLLRLIKLLAPEQKNEAAEDIKRTAQRNQSVVSHWVAMNQVEQCQAVG